MGTEQVEVEGEDNVASRGGLEEVMGAAAGRSPEALGRLPGGSRGAVPESRGEEIMGAADGRSPEAIGRLPGGSRGAVPEHFLM